MISTINITALFINVILCFGVPLTFIVIAFIKKWNCFRAMLFGAAAFCVSQILLRIPLTGVIAGWIPSTQKVGSWQYIVSLIIMAAVFEEGGKYLGMYIGLKEQKRWIDGVAFGMGFAGLYSMFFSGVSYISNIIASFYVNNHGILDLISAFGNDESAAAKFASSLIDSKWYDLLFNGIHDVFWIAIEIALTLVILYGLRLGKKQGLVLLLLAGLSHLLMEGVVNFMGIVLNLDQIVAEIYIVLLGVISIWFIFWSRKHLFLSGKKTSNSKT